MSMRKSGKVVFIRVNPRDCMGVTDLLKAIGIDVEMTFPQAVSIALASALETFRSHQIIPRRTGEEYNRMMQRYKLTERERIATVIKTAKLLKLIRGEEEAAPPTADVPTPEQREKIERLNKLVFIHENFKANMTEEELEEMKHLMLELDPDPDLQQPVQSD